MLFSGAPNKNLWQALSQNENLRASFAVLWFSTGLFYYYFLNIHNKTVIWLFCVTLGAKCFPKSHRFFTCRIGSSIILRDIISYLPLNCNASKEKIDFTILLYPSNSFETNFWNKKPVTAALLDDAAVTQFINDKSCHGRVVCITLFLTKLAILFCRCEKWWKCWFLLARRALVIWIITFKTQHAELLL